MTFTKSKSHTILELDERFTPLPVYGGDEIYQNGIFEFNITRMIDYLESNTDIFQPESISTKDRYGVFSSLNESHMDSVNLIKPVILAEIAPDNFNLIDGNHRFHKAKRGGLQSILAYRLTVEQHIQFLTSYEAYSAYVAYWNGKVQEI